MKKRCLLCGKKFETEAELRDHYINFHKVDPSNAFFKKLFSECDVNRVLNKNCAICGEFEDKPLDIVNSLNIVKYQISYSKHSEYYNFSDSEQVVNEFLTNIKLHF